MVNQEKAKFMVSILEGQIADLHNDLAKVENWVTKSVIKQAIKEQEALLKNAQAKISYN